MQTSEQTTLKRFILIYKVDQSPKNRVLLEQASQIQSYFRLNQLAKKKFYFRHSIDEISKYFKFSEQIKFPKNQTFLSKPFKL